MSNARADLKRRIRRYLSVWKVNIGLDNDVGLTDINSDAEDVCCGLLDILLGTRLQNMNLLQMNFPAIDLADQERRICVQVTSTAGAEKITHTLERFFAHNLERDYDQLIVMVLGKKKDYRKEFPVKEGFSFDPDRDVWDIPKLLLKIAGLSMPQLEEMHDYLRAQRDYREEVAPPMDLPVRSALDDDSFLGREEELKTIGRAFETKKMVLLSGLGGIGKTELAVRFSQTCWGGESYFVHFTKNWKQTVLENIAPWIRGLKPDPANPDRTYRAAMAELKSRGSDELLILDNVDQASSMTALKRELSELRMRILITTRTPGEHAFAVDTLDREALLRLFEIHESDASLREQNALIDAVRGHTLTVDLMARALYPGFMAATAEKLLKNLSDSTIQEVETAYPGGLEQGQIIEHLKVVFRVVELPEEETELLRYATLLPEGGMAAELFLKPFDGAKASILNRLFRHGWLQWKDGLVQIHPVIRKVCAEELKPCDGNCGAYLNTLIDRYDEKEFDADQCRQLAELLDRASGDLEDTRGRWALEAGERWRDIGDSAQAHGCSIRAMEQMEKNLPPDDPALAQAYNNVGCTYGDLGNHRMDLEYQLKALKIREKILSADHPDLAQSYNNVGNTYGGLGDHRKELEFNRKAMAIYEKVLPADHPDLAMSYNNVGCSYGALGDHGKALEYQLKALAIREKSLPPDHPDLATSYNNVGTTYGGLGDYRKALEYKLKALAIREKALPPDHPDLAQSYNNVGCTYGDLGDHRKALEYKLKALEIWEKTLPANHPDLALSCNNIALTYHAMGQYQDAARYMRRAADIISRSTLPEDHPNRVNFRKWADEIEKDARMQQAMLSMMSKPGMPPFGFPKK